MVARDKLARIALWVALAAALLGAVVLPAAAAEAARALLTIADGPVDLLRGAARYRATEGLALAGDDILRTGEATRIARVEFADGRMLDLGPATQLLLLSEATASAHGLAGSTALVIQGWAKLTLPAAVNAQPTPGARLALPALTLQTPPAGSVLVQVAPDGALLAFAESRGATLWRRGAPAAAEGTLREGDAWWRPDGMAAGSVAAGASLAALRAVPRALADALPRRAQRFAGQPGVEPAQGEALEARDLAAWLRQEPALISALRPRLAAWARGGAAPARPATAKGKPNPVRLASTKPASPPPTRLLQPPSAAPVIARTASPALEASALLPHESVQAVSTPVLAARAPRGAVAEAPASTADASLRRR